MLPVVLWNAARTALASQANRLLGILLRVGLRWLAGFRMRLCQVDGLNQEGIRCAVPLSERPLAIATDSCQLPCREM